MKKTFKEANVERTWLRSIIPFKEGEVGYNSALDMTNELLAIEQEKEISKIANKYLTIEGVDSKKAKYLAIGWYLETLLGIQWEHFPDQQVLMIDILYNKHPSYKKLRELKNKTIYYVFTFLFLLGMLSGFMLFTLIH